MRQISRGYYNDQIASAAYLAEVDRIFFWKIFRRSKGNNRSSSHAIKNPSGDVVYSLEEVVNVWRSHFDKISSPKHAPEYDEQHFAHVTRCVKTWFGEGGISEFFELPFSIQEIVKATQKLHLRKALGFDNVTTEHIRHAGYPLSEVLCDLYNICINIEYVPKCFRIGVQVPLYKGKGTCSLNPDNYRGITLLSNFNKLFEVLIWSRLDRWWVQTCVVSDLQGRGVHASTPLSRSRKLYPRSVRGIVRSSWHITMSRRPLTQCGLMDSSSSCTIWVLETPCGEFYIKCTSTFPVVLKLGM